MLSGSEKRIATCAIDWAIEAHFLAAPGEAGEEVKQQDRGEQQRSEASQRQRAAGALTDQGLQRRQERNGQQACADDPQAGEQGGERIDVAGGAVLLQRLQDLADGFAVIVRGTARKALIVLRLEARAIIGDACVEGVVVEVDGEDGLVGALSARIAG